MATAFLRNSSLPKICYSFNSRFLSSRFHTLPEKSQQNSPLAGSRYELLRAFPTANRFLSTNAANPEASQPPPGSNVNAAAQSVGSAEGSSGNKNDGGKSSGGSAEGSSGNKSDGGQSSGGSGNTQQEGKAVRGGPVSWMSFFLLFCTGVGLVYYYDREKRRHIEG